MTWLASRGQFAKSTHQEGQANMGFATVSCTQDMHSTATLFLDHRLCHSSRVAGHGCLLLAGLAWHSLESNLKILTQQEGSFDKQLGCRRKQKGSDVWLLTYSDKVDSTGAQL